MTIHNDVESILDEGLPYCFDVFFCPATDYLPSCLLRLIPLTKTNKPNLVAQRLLQRRIRIFADKGFIAAYKPYIIIKFFYYAGHGVMDNFTEAVCNGGKA